MLAKILLNKLFTKPLTDWTMPGMFGIGGLMGGREVVVCGIVVSDVVVVDGMVDGVVVGSIVIGSVVGVGFVIGVSVGSMQYLRLSL